VAEITGRVGRGWAVGEGDGREGGAGVAMALGEGEAAGRQLAKGRSTKLQASSVSAMTAASGPHRARGVGINR
jgi:hypothetical protein